MGLLMVPTLAGAFEQADLERLLQTNECGECDLAGAPLAQKNLAKAILAKANLQGADLRGAVLRMADLEGANLKDADMSGAVLEAADLFKADLEGAIIKGAIFDGAYLVGTLFDKGSTSTSKATPSLYKKTASVPKPKIEKTAPPVKVVKSGQISAATEEDLIEKSVAIKPEVMATPIQAEAKDKAVDAPVSSPVKQVAEAKKDQPQSKIATTVTTAEKIAPPKQERVVANDSSVAALNPTAAKKAQEKQAEVPENKEPESLSKADLLEKLYDTDKCLECDLSGMDLAKASMKGAYLERVNFEGANLEKANLKGANLKAANLRNANLRGANLEGADLYKADLEGANLTDANLEGASIDGAYLGDANLAGANLEDVIK